MRTQTTKQNAIFVWFFRNESNRLQVTLGSHYQIFKSVSVLKLLYRTGSRAFTLKQNRNIVPQTETETLLCFVHECGHGLFTAAFVDGCGAQLLVLGGKGTSACFPCGSFWAFWDFTTFNSSIWVSGVPWARPKSTRAYLRTDTHKTVNFVDYKTTFVCLLWSAVQYHGVVKFWIVIGQKRMCWFSFL